MTEKQMISTLKGLTFGTVVGSKGVEALEMAIQALSQEPCDDAISRRDIQDYIAKYLSQYLYEDVRQAVEVIDAYIGDMPPVTQKSGKGSDKE